MSHGYPPAPPPPPPPPPRRASSYDRDGYGVVDYYEKYRARPYGLSSYDDRRVSSVPPPPPPPSSALMRERLGASTLDPYERRPLPPPPSAYYAARDRSPIRRAPPTSATPTGNGYSYERSRLSPLSMSRSAYGMPRTRDPYADRVPPPPPARYTY